MSKLCDKEILNVGIIGCGSIANWKHMPALQKNQKVQMTAFCDIDIEKAVQASKKYGSPSSKVYKNYKELLLDKTIDVVHVCTPNRSHSIITIDALESGKHVMCEKPMAINSEDARRMVETAKKTGMKLTIGYQNRFKPESLYLKKLCDMQELGEIYYAKAHAVRRRGVPTWGVFLDEFEQGGGALIDIGTHSLDLTLWMMNNYKPKYVVGNCYYKLKNTDEAANAWGPWNKNAFNVEESSIAFITMENGATILLESSWALNTLQEREAQTTLFGTLAGADLNNGIKINGEKMSRLYETNVGFGIGGSSNEQSSDPSECECTQWIECILNDSDPLVKPEQALVVTEIIEAIYKSSKNNEIVYFK